MEEQVTIESEPRGKGKTTRQANEAIEWLFNNPGCWLWVVDHSENAHQSHLLTERILNRLKEEHQIYENLGQSFAWKRPYVVAVDRQNDNDYIKLNPIDQKEKEDKQEIINSQQENIEVSTITVSIGKSAQKEPTQIENAIKFVEDSLVNVQNELVKRVEITITDRVRILKEIISLSAQLIELKKLASNQPQKS